MIHHSCEGQMNINRSRSFMLLVMTWACLVSIAHAFSILPVALSNHQHQSSPPASSSTSSNDVERREILRSTALVSGSLSLLTRSPLSSNAEGEGAKEVIAKAASAVPGYGQPDAFYPEFFEGEWRMTREVVGLSAPQGEDKADPLDLAEAKALANEKKLEYTVRYVKFPGANADQVVADRGYNEASKEAVRFADKSDLWKEGITPRWSPSNPNVLTVTFPDGLVREIKVAKRSFEKPSDDAFGLREFARIAEAQQDTGVASVPRISAIRTLQKFKLVDPVNKDVIDGLELVKYYPTVSLSPDPAAVLTLKTRLRLEKIK